MRIGNETTANKAPFTDAFEIIAATKVVAATRPSTPKARTTINGRILSVEASVKTKNIGVIIDVIVISRVKLNNNFPIYIEFGSAVKLRISEVPVSSSLINVWAKPDIAEKNIIIQKRAERIFGDKPDCPKANETTANVVTPNIIMAFKPDLVRSSKRRSLK